MAYPMSMEELSKALSKLNDQEQAALMGQLSTLKTIAEDEGVIAAHGRWMTPTVLIAAGVGVLFPLSGIGGMLGLVGLGGSVVGIPVVGFAMFNRERKAIREGDTELLQDLLSDEKLQSIKNAAITLKMDAVKKLPLPEITPENLGAIKPQGNPQTQTQAQIQTPPLKLGDPILFTPSTPHSPQSGKNLNPETQTLHSTQQLPDGSPEEMPPNDHLKWHDGDHVVMIGLSGSSKTTTLVQCTPTDAPVIYATIKSADVAPEHWVTAKFSKIADVSFIKAISDFCDVIEDLIKRGVKHRLIIDEALSIFEMATDAEKLLYDKDDKEIYKGTANRFLGLIKVYIRSGRSDGHYLGLVTQSPNGTDLFKSAKTMEGLRTILCFGEASSNKFEKAVSWARQKFGEKLTETHVKILNKLHAGFWHCWMSHDGLHLRPTQLTNVELIPCKTFSKLRVMQDLKLTRAQVVEHQPKDQNTVKPTEENSQTITVEELRVESLADKILSTLKASTEPMTLRDIREKTKFKNESADNYKQRAMPIIQRFISEQVIEEFFMNGGIIKYKVSQSI